MAGFGAQAILVAVSDGYFVDWILVVGDQGSQPEVRYGGDLHGGSSLEWEVLFPEGCWDGVDVRLQ